MRYRTLGSSDVVVSEVGFGVWTMAAGWWGTYSDEEAVRLMHRAFDLGITFFDTAPTYGEGGRGEALVAQAFGDRRDGVVYSTKFGYDVDVEWGYEGHRERPHRVDAEYTRRAVEASLRRLETDVIDVLQLHNPRLEHLQHGELWDLMERLKAEGKVRAYGVSIGPKIGWRDEGVYALEHLPGMQAFMMIHNLLEQDPGRDFLEAARARSDVGVTVRVPHSSGLLEGKYTKDTTFDENDHRSHRQREWLTQGLRKLEKLGFLEREMTLGQAAIKWLLADPLVASVLPNIYNGEQLEEFAAAPELPDLSAEDLALVRELYDNGFFLEPEPAGT